MPNFSIDFESTGGSGRNTHRAQEIIYKKSFETVHNLGRLHRREKEDGEEKDPRAEIHSAGQEKNHGRHQSVLPEKSLHREKETRGEEKSSPPEKGPAAKKAPATKAAPKGRRVAEAVKKQGEAPVKKATQVTKGKPLTKRELKQFQKLLLELRERLQGDIRFLTTDNLHRAGRETGADLSGAAQHSADHGTDNFDREFALSLASTEQDVLYEVDEALMRIEDGEYGVCELTGVQIERARLEVIPYTRYSVQAQAKMEQSRAQYRPFSQTFKGW